MDARKQAVLPSVLSDGYNSEVEDFRELEYPQLNGVTYVDHAGAALHARSAIQAFSADLCANLYGNPHSPSPSSQLSTKKIDHVRLRVLQLYEADPEEFDLVFCANATAAMKLVVEAFSRQPAFNYKHHADAHTSLIGIRELARESQCFLTDADVERWLDLPKEEGEELGLFGWPGQSNFTGRRLPLDWAGKLRRSHPCYYSLLDAAALLTTAPLDFSDAAAAPDFTALSFYKIFGFPDLGGLIVRRSSAGILRSRRYFGGGTVDSLVATRPNFVARKNDDPHSHLEDGTLPFHSIVALDAAMNTHERLYGNCIRTGRHAFALGKLAYTLMSNLTHGNSRKLCMIYGGESFQSASKQGPIIAFNMQRADGTWIGYAEVEKLASVKNIHLRVGSMCNPGAIELCVGLRAWEIEQNHAAGHKCSDDMDVMNGKPTGAIRVSFGAMSTIDDVLCLVRFLEEFYVDKESTRSATSNSVDSSRPQSVVESISIYPIKSCAGFKVPSGVPWDVRPHGLAWDREWCLVHLGTGAALSQKSYTKMALIRPEVDLDAGLLRVSAPNVSNRQSLDIPLAGSPTDLKSSASRVCGDKITALIYNSPEITAFFTAAVGVPCTLARFPAESTDRNYKPNLNKETPLESPTTDIKKPKILLSNESPILVVNRSSVDELNTHIRANGGKCASADVFRANIILRDIESIAAKGGGSAYKEDGWRRVQIGREHFELLGPCRRCHMINIDQDTAEKNEEPFVTLSKTRRVGGRVLFGMHATHLPLESNDRVARIAVGETVRVWGIEGNVQEEADERKVSLAGRGRLITHDMDTSRAVNGGGAKSATTAQTWTGPSPGPGNGCDRGMVAARSVKVALPTAENPGCY